MHRRTLLPLLLAVILPPASVSSSPWREIAPPPVASAGFARGARTTGPMVAGGNRWDKDSKLTLDETWSYHPANRAWHATARLPRPFALGVHGMVGDTLYLAGGDDGTTTRDEVMTVDQNGAGSLIARLPHPVAYAGGAILQGRLYLLGGSADASKPLAMHDRFLRVDLTNGGVETLTPFPDGPIIHAAVVAGKESIYVFTGGQVERSTARIVNSGRAWRFHPANGQWTRLPDYPLPVRGLAGIVLEDHRILLAGGYHAPKSGEDPPTFTDASFVFDPVAQTYRPAPPLPYDAMFVGLVSHDKWVYAFGGESAPRERATRAYRAAYEELVRTTAP